jgi:hypothetical protein
MSRQYLVREKYLRAVIKYPIAVLYFEQVYIMAVRNKTDNGLIVILLKLTLS